MATRRQFLQAAAVASAATMVPLEITFAPALRGLLAVAHAASPTITPFTDPLPWLLAPGFTAQPDTNTYPGADYYEIAMKPGAWRFSSKFASASPTWGYWAGATGIGYLGPTIVAQQNRPVVVKYINQLPTSNASFPVSGAIDPTIMGADLAPGRAVPHLHGGFTPPQFDGHPDAWWAATAGGSTNSARGANYATLPGANPNEAIFWYSNQQPATMLWYHDHARGITRLNAYVGLAALYFIRDSQDTGLPSNPLGLPAGPYEVPLVLQDKSFDNSGNIFYPTTNGYTPNSGQPHAIWVPEFFGDTPVVNAVAYPFMEVEPRRYRFRIVNGAQARFFDIWFEDLKVGKDLPLWTIGMEQSLLPAAAQLKKLLIAPGERADVIFDFTGLTGATITLMNDARAPFPGGDRDVPSIPKLVQFRVTKSLTGTDTTKLPGALVLPKVQALKVDTHPEREVVLKETVDAFDQPIVVMLNERPFDAPSEENPKLNSVEVWDFINTTGDAHPMHMHLVKFQVVNRQAFASEKYLAAYTAWVAAGRPATTKPALTSYLSGPTMPPPAEETGWKDTAKAYPGQVLRVKAKFEVPNPPGTNVGLAGTGTLLPATYVYHCHILEHEENDMMRPFQVIA
jgi:spore coat protein A, manganese oxidase